MPRYEMYVKVVFEAEDDPTADGFGDEIVRAVNELDGVESATHEWPEVLYD